MTCRRGTLTAGISNVDRRKKSPGYVDVFGVCVFMLVFMFKFRLMFMIVFMSVYVDVDVYVCV